MHAQCTTHYIMHTAHTHILRSLGCCLSSPPITTIPFSFTEPVNLNITAQCRDIHLTQEALTGHRIAVPDPPHSPQTRNIILIMSEYNIIINPFNSNQLFYVQMTSHALSQHNSVIFHLADVQPFFPWLENGFSRAIYGLVQTLDLLRINLLVQAVWTRAIK